ncbi:MAG: homoserine O-acetyltransferase [Alphaproteobacteria bacterium]|jgi:homoserine O-acetyltransferase
MMLLAYVCFSIGPAAASDNHQKTQAAPASSEAIIEPMGMMLVTKQVHHIDTFTTFGGDTIKNVKVGWESYGSLNASKSNVVLITHYFTGTSHAEGKYKTDDAQAGYWDSIIGPGKAIDTERFLLSAWIP